MPDPTHKTVSASQMSALFDQSRYSTRWQLFQEFANGISEERDGDETAEWGTRLQPAILGWAADNLRVTGLEDNFERYVSHPDLPIGCTIDGFAREQRGPVVVEAKCCNYPTWADRWRKGAIVPPDIEIQVQTQMMLPVGDLGPPVAGFIVVLVGGFDVHVFERTPEPDLQAEIVEAATTFISDVEAKREPPIVVGNEEMSKALGRLYPPEKMVPGPLDLRGMDDDGVVGELLAQFRWAREQESFHKKFRAEIGPALLRHFENNNKIRVSGFWGEVKKSRVAANIVRLPNSIRDKLQSADAAIVEAGITEACAWEHVARKESVRQAITVDPVENEEPADPPVSLAEITIGS